MPATRRRILVIANETCASRAVCDEVRYRAGDGGGEVLVIAPALARSRLGHWFASDAEAGREEAEERVRASVAAMRAAGLRPGRDRRRGPAPGPRRRAARVPAGRGVIATHPPSRSHWLERRIVKRARERYPLPVTHVVVDLEHERASAEEDERVRVDSNAPRLRLYHHAASYEEAMAIAGRGGFGDGGVASSDRPEDGEERMGFALDIPEDVVAPYEQGGPGEARASAPRRAAQPLRSPGGVRGLERVADRGARPGRARPPSEEDRVATADRRAETEWEGALTTGSGEVSLASSGAGSFPVTWASRVEKADGRTSPEELLAAAHASCYSMAFSATLGRGDTPPERLHVVATVSLNPKEGGGFQVTDSKLEVTGVVPGLDQAGFQSAAETAEQGCPISNAIRNNVAITVTATLQ